MALKSYEVNIIEKGCGSHKVIIEANNPPQARRYAEGRYPGAKIGSVNTAR